MAKTKKKVTKAKRAPRLKRSSFEDSRRELLEIMLRMEPSTAYTTVQLMTRMLHTALAMRMGEHEATVKVASMLIGAALIHLRSSHPGPQERFAKEVEDVFRGCVDGLEPMGTPADSPAKSKPN
jgi:hypothetical protein